MQDAALNTKEMKEKYMTREQISIKYKLSESLVRKWLGSDGDHKDYIKGKVNYNIHHPLVKALIKYGHNGMITKTTAKKDYKLKDAELEKLYSKSVKNPIYACAKPMILFFKDQVELTFIKKNMKQIIAK